MILYNLTIKIEEDIEEEWLEWMQIEFIPKAMSTDTFSDHRLCRLLNLDELDGATYALQLFCKNMDQLKAFQNQEEQELQLKLVRKFPNRLVFFPTAMEVL